MARFVCPHCTKPLSFSTRWHMTGLLQWRRVQPCPSCGAELRWSVAAYLVNAASLAGVVVFVGWHRVDLFGVFVLLAAGGVRLLRVETVRARDAA
jgi:hypothetical protein